MPNERDAHTTAAAVGNPRDHSQSRVVSSRLLDFLLSSKTEREFTRERFRQFLQLPPHALVGEGAEDEHVFTEDGSEWTTTVAFFESKPGHRRVEFSIDHPSLHDGTSSADLTPACVWTSEQYAQALRNAGFREGPSLPPWPSVAWPTRKQPISRATDRCPVSAIRAS